MVKEEEIDKTIETRLIKLNLLNNHFFSLTFIEEAIDHPELDLMFAKEC